MANKRLNWYFPDGATYSFIQDTELEEGEYRKGVDDETDEVVDSSRTEKVGLVEDNHGDVTILVVSPA